MINIRSLLGIFALSAIAGLSSCKTPPPPGPVPSPFSVTATPSYGSGIDLPANEYEIHAYASTNYAEFADATNSWPRRVNIDLSVDGGSNYTRRIAHGIPTEDRHVYYTYSLPWRDPSLITEEARLRVTHLDGSLYCESKPFTIAGLRVTSPAAGDIVVNATFIDITWIQAGAGSTVDLGYITPEVGFTLLTTLSGAVAGGNTVAWEVSGLPQTNLCKLVIRSATDARVWGASGVFEVQ